MFCKQCGNEILENEIKCSKCNTKIGKGAVYCDKCGKKNKDCECQKQSDLKEDTSQNELQKSNDTTNNIKDIVLPKSNIYTEVSINKKTNNSSLFQKLLAQQQMEEQSIDFSLQPKVNTTSDIINVSNNQENDNNKEIKNESKTLESDEEIIKNEESNSENKDINEKFITENKDMLDNKKTEDLQADKTHETEKNIIEKEIQEKTVDFSNTFKDTTLQKIPQEIPQINKKIFNKSSANKCNFFDYLGIASLFIGLQGNIISLVLGIFLGFLGCFGNFKIRFGISGIIISIISFIIYLLVTYTTILTILPF